MARVTVEDCLKKVKNHFQLVIIASKRARQIAKGGMAMVDPENDKPTVIALREIANGRLNEAEEHVIQEGSIGGSPSTSF